MMTPLSAGMFSMPLCSSRQTSRLPARTRGRTRSMNHCGNAFSTRFGAPAGFSFANVSGLLTCFGGSDRDRIEIFFWLKLLKTNCRLFKRVTTVLERPLTINELYMNAWHARRSHAETAHGCKHRQFVLFTGQADESTDR